MLNKDGRDSGLNGEERRQQIKTALILIFKFIIIPWLVLVLFMPAETQAKMALGLIITLIALSIVAGAINDGEF